ncbi:hypothetical protein ABFA07_015107 [Porites harrisoni]
MSEPSKEFKIQGTMFCENKYQGESKYPFEEPAPWSIRNQRPYPAAFALVEKTREPGRCWLQSASDPPNKM